MKVKDGSAGAEGEDFEAIEAKGWAEWRRGIIQELRTKTYQPKPVNRVGIDKPGGGQRPLGIPGIKDGVGQTAAQVVLEPICEADLEPNA